MSGEVVLKTMSRVRILLLAIPAMLAMATVTAQALLKASDSGPGVTKLQEALAALNFYKGKIDGKFGAGTTRAVKSFQEKKGLPSDGIAGDKTMAALFKNAPVAEKKLEQGSRDVAEVKRLQELLNKAGAGLKVDGKFGATTVAAFENFQRAKGLQPVDGVVGAKTWEKLKLLKP